MERSSWAGKSRLDWDGRDCVPSLRRMMTDERDETVQ